MSVYLFLTDGFEEIEALATVDILRRGEVDIKTVSLTGKKEVVSSRKIPVIADCLFNEVDFATADYLIIPGGTTAFNDYPELKEVLKKHYSQNKRLAAICAAPMVLGEAGLLQGKKATCYPSFEKYLHGAEVRDGVAVVVDGLITTGRGPGLALDFAFAILEQIQGKAVKDKVKSGMLL